jgi:hypothetical protein
MGAVAFGHHPNTKEQYDMKYVKIMGLCLVAALALRAVVAATASANPYGFYKDGTGNPATGATYTSKLLSKTARLVTTSNGEIICTAATGSGKIISLDNAEGAVAFTGCKFGSFSCNNSGAKAGEIIVNEITVLAVLERLLGTSEKQPALLFKPLKDTDIECTSLQKFIITNTSGTLGGLLGLIPKAASEPNGWLGTNSEGRLFHVALEQTEGLQKGAEKGTGEGEFLESEAGEIMKSGLTAEGMGVKNFKELVAVEAEFSIETSEKISIFA